MENLTGETPPVRYLLCVVPCKLYFLNVVTTFGVDKIHFGLIMVTAMVIGQVTPPVGINLFVGSRILGIKVEKMFKWLPIFLAVMVLDLLIVTFIPQLSLFLLG